MLFENNTRDIEPRELDGGGQPDRPAADNDHWFG
jgi:hypothetical protein